MSQIKTSEKWKARRDTFLKSIGINYASRFIPIMLDQCQAFLKEVKVGEEFNMSRSSSLLTFDIICMILFVVFLFS